MATPNKPPKKKSGKPKSNRANQMTVGQAIKKSSQIKAADRRAYKLELLAQRGRRAALAKYNRKRLALQNLMGDRCRPSTQVYGGASQGDKSWICSSLHQITFKEKNYDIRECEIRVFIEGAEVTPYVRGNVSWSIQTTGGMNTCTFSLNNNHDTFILTPANICSQKDLHGWRVPLNKKRQLITAPSRITRNVDETAKYIIYKNKFDRIRPGEASQQIDEAGFWLYPLNPFHSVITKHDCVRVFYRLPHVTPAKPPRGKNKFIQYEEVWAPAFTGFVDEYDFEDDPVGGDRVMNIRCYDWRGLLNRMRVRMLASNTASAAAKKARQQTAIFDEQHAEKKKDKVKGQTADFFSVISVLGIDEDLNALYKSKVAALVAVNCRNEQNKTACQREIQKETRGGIAALIAEMRLLYLGGMGGPDGKTKVVGLKKAVEDLNEAEGFKAILKRSPKDDNTIILDTGGKRGAEAAESAVDKVAPFLKTSGKSIATLAQEYAVLYQAISDSKKSSRTTVKKATDFLKGLAGSITGLDVSITATYNQAQDLTDPKANPKMFKELNLDTSIVQKDKEVVNNSNLPAGFRKTIEKDRTSSRTYLINAYVYTILESAFRGVTTKIKNELDARVKEKTGRRIFNTPKVSFTVPGSADFVAAALVEYTSIHFKVSKANEQINDRLARFNNLYKQVRHKLKRTVAEELAALKSDPNVRRRAKIDEMRKKIDAQRKKTSVIKNSEAAANIADLVLTDARFSQVDAGMYGDLIRVSKRDPHPLAGMSFEMAVEWLTQTHTTIEKGFEDKLSIYDRGALQKWNLNILFGVIGRPLTYREVTEMGTKSTGDLDTDIAPYSPLHAFMHLLLPKDGTGALSIVQQDITHNTFKATNYSYQTRLSLLNEICETLDYQFFVSPAGDLVFEFPHYNAMPYDFGKVFQGAYTIVKGLRSFKLASEQGELNTAWVLTGQEREHITEVVGNKYVVREPFKKNVIVANVLARRIGVKVRHIKISLPGVGAIFKNSPEASEASRLAFGLLEIQRELGRMETASVQHDFRPYMLPNRPIHVVHRQRMALVRNVNYSMTPPDGECTTSVDLHYVRGLHNDGSFRHMVGGTRLPVDYSGLYTGDVSQNLRFGSDPRRHKLPGKIDTLAAGYAKLWSTLEFGATAQQSQDLRNSVLQMLGQQQPRNFSNWACGPFMRDIWLTSGPSYADQMDATFRKADRYTSWTQGASGIAGDYPPLPRGGANYIANRTYRPTKAKGQPDSAVTFDGTSMNMATTKGDDTKTPKKSSTSAYYGNLYNPWPYGRRMKGHLNLFNQFGFYRYIYRNGQPGWIGKSKGVGRYLHRGKDEGWHNGIDFFGNTLLGEPAYTPIPLTTAFLTMGTGWTGYRDASKYTWSKLYPQGTYRPDGEEGLFVARDSKGRIIFKPVYKKGSGIPEGVKFKIEGVTRSIYQKIKKQYGFTPNVDKTAKANLGMMMLGWGYAKLPGNASSKVACKLRYIHIGDLVKHPTAKRSDGKSAYIGDWIKNREQRAIPANTPLCKVGLTASNSVHLHFEMQVYRPGANVPALGGTVGGDESSYKEVLKANAEFLRTQVKMRLTGGTAGLKKNTLSPRYQQYFSRLNKKRKKQITTVDQAVDYLLLTSGKFQKATSDSRDSIVVNPMFFFLPEQIIKKYKNRYQRYQKARPENYFDVGSGSSICGNNNAVLQKKISLEYTACLLGVKKNSKIKKKRDGRKVCRAVRDKRRAELKQRKTRDRTGQQTGGRTHNERVSRKLDARIRANTHQHAGNRAARDHTVGS